MGRLGCQGNLKRRRAGGGFAADPKHQAPVGRPRVVAIPLVGRQVPTCVEAVRFTRRQKERLGAIGRWQITRFGAGRLNGLGGRHNKLLAWPSHRRRCWQVVALQKDGRDVGRGPGGRGRGKGWRLGLRRGEFRSLGGKAPGLPSNLFSRAGHERFLKFHARIFPAGRHPDWF